MALAYKHVVSVDAWDGGDIYIYTHTYICIYIYTYIHTYIRIHTYIHTHTYIHIGRDLHLLVIQFNISFIAQAANPTTLVAG